MNSRQPTLPLADPDADEVIEVNGEELLALCKRCKADGRRVVALKVKGARYFATVRKSTGIDVTAGEKGHVARL